MKAGFSLGIPMAASVKAWKLMHPCLWGNPEVLDWIYSVAESNKLRNVSGESFKDVCGAKLTKMSPDDFLIRDKINGPVFQRHLQSLLRLGKFSSATQA